VPAFFGLGVIWQREAPYADELEEILEPWDRNPMVERLEANRVLHLAAWQLEGGRFAWCHERAQRKDAVLRKLLQSKAFALAIALSRLRQGGAPASSRSLDGTHGMLPCAPRRRARTGGQDGLGVETPARRWGWSS